MRKALLVGINDYDGCPLRGCLNDASSMACALTGRQGAVNDVRSAEAQLLNFGWSVGDIRLLTEKRATTKAIREHLEWLVERASPGDTLLFHYSGHGAQMALRGCGGHVETLHDCICPVDFDWSEDHALLDRDFATIFVDIPKGVSLTWISDSCHSGDLAREIPCSLGGNDYRVPRAFPVPADIAWRNQTALEEGRILFGFARAIEHLHGVLLAGCKSSQTSADAYIDGKYCGAFTTALLHQLALPNGAKKPAADLIEYAGDWLEARKYEQDPQVRGDPEHTGKPFLWTDPV